jgi:hypothetical protein
MRYTAEQEQMLMTEVFDPQIADDLYNFVMFAYPWGRPNTPLENFKGPRSWQIDDLHATTEHLKHQKECMAQGERPRMLRTATSSGRGIGKSALVAWKQHWRASTRLGSTGIVTANTEMQLKSRTFAEITKWNTLAINGHWFDTTVLSVRPAPWFEAIVKRQLSIDTGYYYTQGQLWSEENPDAFAGVHNPLGVMVTFDEASGIPSPIFKVTEGFFTEPTLYRFWDIFSNPRRNSGAFFDCFNNDAAFWKTRQVDSRTVEDTDQALFDRMIAQYGIDSDTVRVEILGKFPAQGNKQFISNSLVFDAQEREVQFDPGAPLVMGVDIARYGDDATTIRWRQGRDAKSIPAVTIKDRDNMYVANEVARYIDMTNPDAVCIDAGNGTGVIDRLREMKYKVHEVWFGSTSMNREWANKRTEMYADLRTWLTGGTIDKSKDLFRDLTAPEYDYYGKAQDQQMLESKENMKARGLPSPDHGDALAMTFAVKVARRDRAAGRSGRSRSAKGVDSSPFR